MRTTLTLDDDLAEKLQALARARGLPFRQVLNEMLRRGLAGQGPRRKPAPFRVDTFRSAFRAGIDPVKLNQLSDELEIERGRKTLAR